MHETSELHSWICEIKLEYTFEKDTDKAIKLRHKYIKLRRIYDKMIIIQREWIYN